MVVNAYHYRRLTVKLSFDIENTLLDGDNAIDFPIKPHDLSRHDGAVMTELTMERLRENLESLGRKTHWRYCQSEVRTNISFIAEHPMKVVLVEVLTDGGFNLSGV